MPEVELCRICQKKIDTNKEEYVVIRKEHQGQPRAIAHPACRQRQDTELQRG